MKTESIARICHEANRAYCISLGDLSQKGWDNAPSWQKESAINGVKYHLENPDSKPEDSHNNWLKEKEADGWKYGEVKDPEKKEHPCFVPYSELPEDQKKKDALFIAVVRTFAGAEESGESTEEKTELPNFKFRAVHNRGIITPVIPAENEEKARELLLEKYPLATIHACVKI